MTMRWTGGAALMALSVLAGCGGGTATNDTPTAQTDPVKYFDTVVGPGYKQYRSDLVGDSYAGTTGLPNAAFTAMPTTGSATYTGYALLTANRDGTVAGLDTLGVEGTATLTADFAASSLTGSATNFVGTSNSGQDPTTGAYNFSGSPAYYAGTIQITNGCIGNAAGCSNVTRPNQYSAQFSGTLNGEGNTVVTTGDLLGDFKGTPIQGVTAISNTINTTLNGTSVPSGFFAFVKP